MKKIGFLRLIGIGMITAVLLLSAGCNKNNDEKNSESGEIQSGAESAPNTAGDQNDSSAGGSADDAGSSSVSGSFGFGEDDPDQSVSSDGAVTEQPGSGQQEEGFAGEGAGSEGNSPEPEPPGEGTAEQVPNDENDSDNGGEETSKEEVTYDEKAAQEYADYLALDNQGREAFYDSFSSDAAFKAWKEPAKAAYDAKQAAETTDGTINLHDYIKKES